MFRRTAQFTFAIGVLAVITLSLIPKEALPETGIWDKLHHVLAYGGLAAEAGEKLVVRPAAYTFSRCLGCFGGEH